MSNADEDADFWQLTREERLRYYHRLLGYALRRLDDAMTSYEQGYSRSARRRLDGLRRRCSSIITIIRSRQR